MAAVGLAPLLGQGFQKCRRTESLLFLPCIVPPAPHKPPPPSTILASVRADSMWPGGLAWLLRAAGQTGSCSAGADACTEEQVPGSPTRTIATSLRARMGLKNARSVPPPAALLPPFLCHPLPSNAGGECRGADQEPVPEPPADIRTTTDGCALDIQC